MENKNKKDTPKSRVMTLTIKGVVVNAKNEFLVLRRAKSSKFSGGRYDLPGGHIEGNESLKDSVVREIKEETGLDVRFGEIIDVVEFPEDSQQFKDEKRGIRCICYVEGDPEVELSFEHDEFKWVSFEKAAEVFSDGNGFEKEKLSTVMKAKKYLELKRADDSCQRLAADFENYKKRQAEERKDMIAFSNAQLLSEIIPVLDNFHASTDHIPEEQRDGAWVVGIMHIQTQLEKVLEDNGVLEIPVKVGDEFDPATMEALENGERKKKESDNKVEKVVQKGYKMGGKVLRAARVIVE